MSKSLRFKGESSSKPSSISKKKKKLKSTSTLQTQPLWREVDVLNGLVVIYYNDKLINHVGGTEYLSLKEVRKENYDDIPDTTLDNPDAGLDTVTIPDSNPKTTTNNTSTLPLPQVGSQVFKSHSLPGSSKVVFKSCFEKYIGVDKLGIVTCQAEAAGGCEMWEGIKVDGKWAFKGFFGGYPSD